MLNNENHMTDDLLVSYLLGEADDPTRNIVEQWIIETPANQKYFEHFRIIWEASKEIKIPDTVDENAAWQRFKQRTAETEKAPVISIGRKLSKLKIAASVLIIASVIAFSYLIWDRSTSGPVVLASVEKPQTDILPDGSTVTLSKNSSITYSGRFKGEKRKINLKGEALFDVKTNKNKPFVVEVNDVTITVLGTVFRVKNTGGNTEVFVESGAVQVTKNNKTVILKAREKVMVCDNTPLWKLAEILNEAYQVNITIENNEIKNLPLTTTFYNESLDNILNIISETFNITVERNANTIILK